MERYAKVIDEKTKACEVGIGTDEAFFKSSGMELKEVEEASNGSWYLKGYLPKPTLPEAKLNKKVEINNSRDEARIKEGASYDKDIFDIDEVSQSNIMAQIKVAELLQDPEAKYIYRSKTNKDHLFNKGELEALGLAIAQKVSEIYKKSWDLKEKVDKATTLEEVNAITW